MEDRTPQSNKFLFATVLVITALLSSLLTAVIVLRRAGTEEESFAPLVEASGIIEKNYYFADQTSGQARVEAALRGMVDSIGDAYAQYMTEEEYREMLAADSGVYIGIGIVVLTPDERGSMIDRVYDGGPASEAGVHAGDIILSVNGTAAAGMPFSDMLALFSEDDAIPDTLVLLRGETEFTVQLYRREVHVPKVTSEMLGNSVGYIRIEEFTGQVASEFSTALDALFAGGMQKLVLDVRNNPGGGLTEVLDVTDSLLPAGSLIATRRSRTEEEMVYKAKKAGVSLPIAVLVNGNSASASELFTGALRDNGMAVVVGERTFGKGIVQSYYRLKNGAGWVKLTSDAYYTPSGVCIQGTGIEPDVAVALAETMQTTTDLANLPHEDDAQLQAALAALENQ